jgi:tetratricopeptide (TPR) repeat protein
MNNYKAVAASTMIQLNNLGVERLESGGFNEARQLFSLALDLMKTIIDQENPARSRNAEVSRSAMVDHCSSIVILPQRPTPSEQPATVRQERGSPYSSSTPRTDDTLEQEETQLSQSSKLYIFSRPVYFVEDLDYEHPPLVKLSISLLYNLALSYHAITLRGQEEDSSNPNMIEAALLHYQLAYDLQIRDGIELSTFHTMGIINNVGQIHAGKGDIEKARVLFELLLKTLMVYLDQTQNQGRDGLESNDLVAGFLRNLTQSVFRPSSSPAA